MSPAWKITATESINGVFVLISFSKGEYHSSWIERPSPGSQLINGRSKKMVYL